MSTNLKTIRVLDFDGKASNWEGWSEKFLARAKRKGYKELLTGKKNVPTKEDLDDDKVDAEITKLGELNEEAFEDIILSIDHSKKAGKIAFSLVKNCRNSAYPEGNCKLAWDRMVAKYAPKTAPSLLKLKKQFANSVLDDPEKHPEEWITKLESLRNDMEQIHIATKMSDLDFLIHILNNLPEMYDVVLDGMESRLMLKDGDYTVNLSLKKWGYIQIPTLIMADWLQNYGEPVALLLIQEFISKGGQEKMELPIT